MKMVFDFMRRIDFDPFDSKRESQTTFQTDVCRGWHSRNLPCVSDPSDSYLFNRLHNRLEDPYWKTFSQTGKLALPSLWAQGVENFLQSRSKSKKD